MTALYPYRLKVKSVAAAIIAPASKQLLRAEPDHWMLPGQVARAAQMLLWVALYDKPIRVCSENSHGMQGCKNSAEAKEGPQRECRHSPPIMMPTAPMVDLSCFLPIMKRSNTMVHSRVKRRRAMNIGTFRPAVPAASRKLERCVYGAPVCQSEQCSGPQFQTACTRPRPKLKETSGSPIRPQTTFRTLTTARGIMPRARPHSSFGLATM